MEDEGRQKKVEAGRVKFAAYLKKKNASDQQSDQKKKKKIENDSENSKEMSVGVESLDSSSLASSLEYMEGIKFEISGGTSGTTTTLDDSKQSIKDEGEVSSERLQTRLKQLEDILSGKEAALEAAHEELSALKEITSFDASTGMLETDYKNRFEECHKRLLEFQEAVQHREGIISQLSSSLQQAIQSRDALQLQGDQLAQEVALLQCQLKATTALIQGHHWDTGIKPHDYLTLQNQLLALEVAVTKNESVISNLNSVIKENASELQCKSDDLEKKSQELSQHKTKSANEIQKLMREVEELHQKCAVMASNNNSLMLEHERQMAALQSELEENFGLQLVHIKEELRNQFDKEKAALERRHAEEMAFCQKLAAESSRAVEEPTTSSNHQLQSLHLQLQESSEAREKLVKEMTELKHSYMLEAESFKQKNVVLEEQMEAVVKEKEIYEQQILEARNNSENELAVYKQQIENLKFQLQETKHSERLHDCKKAFEAELSSYKHSHEMELSLYKEQVDNLNLQLHEASKAEAKYLSQLIESKKAYEAEIISCQQSHEMELSSYKQRADALNLRLQEASETEANFPKVLAAHKQSLEAEVCRYKEENEALNTELQRILSNEDILRMEKAELLETHNSAVLSYEEQLATLKIALQAAEETVKNHERELSSIKKRFEDSINVNESYMNEVKNYKEQIVTLNTQLKEALNMEKTLELDFAHCKKLHGEEINLIEKKIESEYTERGTSIARCQSDEPELTLCREQIEYLNLRLQDSNEAEKCHISEITACQIQLKEYKEQVESLDRRFSEELIHAQEDFSKEINSKNQEIEILLARLQEAAVVEEKYKSQMLSLQKDIENLNMQLHQRAETVELASCEEQRTSCSNQVQASQSELQAYKQKMESSVEGLEYKLSQLQGCHDAELKRIEEEQVAHIASREVDGLTVQLGESIKANERLEKEKQIYHESCAVEVDKCKHQLDELNTQLQDCRKNEGKFVSYVDDCREQLSTTKNQVELQKAKVQDDMSQIKVLHTREVNDLKDQFQYLKNIKATLEAEVVCLNEAAKHRDDASRAQLEEVTVQFLKTQSLLEAKEEIEKAYERRIIDLQVDLDKANCCIDQMKREINDFQEVTVQNLKLQGLLAAKEEAECMLIERAGEQGEALCAVERDCEQMKHEISQLTLKLSEAEDLLKKLTFEKDELSEEYKRLEAERERLVSEKEMSEDKLKDLTSQVCKLQTSSDIGGSVVSYGSSHLPPVAETCRGAVITRLECASVTDFDNNNGQAVVPVSGFGSTEGVNYNEDRGDSFESGPWERQKQYTVNVSDSCLSLCAAKWMERLTALEGEKIELAGQLETLESKLQEKELQEHLYNQQNKATILRCKELEEKLLQLEKVRIERDKLLQEKDDLKSKVVGLEHENATFQKLQEALNIELAEERVASEDRLHQGMKERLEYIIDEKNCTTIENLILGFGQKTKEIVFLKERLRSQEQASKLLNEKILILENYKAEDAKKINLCHEELARVRSELEESWKQHQATIEELGACRKELAMLYVQKQQLESSRNRLLQMSANCAVITPVSVSTQQEMHSMLEELATEVQALKSSLQDEQCRSEKLAQELELVQNSGSAMICLGVTDVNSNDSSNSGMLELQQKLELILKSNTELIAEKESLLHKLRNQQQLFGKLQQAGGHEQVESWMSNLDKQQRDLMAELQAYREQHMSLAELVGSTGVLQETLFRQKQELLQKFKEKSAVEKMLENERVELKSAQLKMQMMESQMLEKDNIFQELTRQKRVLEQDLHEIEDCLRDQEDMLQMQKLTLESEICDRDLRIRHWQLELKAKQVEVNSKMILTQHSAHSATESNQNGEWERLEMFRSKLEEVHQQAVTRLKLYMEEQFAVRETELQKNYASEVFTLQQQHKEQLMGLQQQLAVKAKELEALLNSELHSQLGISQNLVTRLKAEEMAALKERQRSELEELKNKLDVQQMGMYSVLKQKFEEYAEQKIAIALKIVQDEHDSVHQQTVSNLILKHTEELKVLQAKLESQRQGELLLLRKDLSKKHSDELNEVTKGLKLEISLLKQSHDGSSSRSSVQQLKQEMCMEYTSTLKGWVQTWYSDCQEQLEALNKQIYDLWQQDESASQETGPDMPAKAPVSHTDIKRLLECKELLLTQAEVLHTEVAKRHMQALHSLQFQLDAEHAKLVQKVEHMKKTVQEGTTVASLQDQISKLVADKEELENKHKLAMDLLAHEHDVEVAKLRDIIANVKCGNISGLTELRQEMETKHTKEMEELRQYFEQKCADVEKHYSEEVFNQHSRKLSGSSSGLENEDLVSEMYYAGGDSSQHLTALTHICDSYSVEPSFKDLEENYQKDFEKRLVEYRDQLETVKLELEEKYQNEMEVLREEYESKVEDLVRDLSNTHKTEIQNIESKHAKEIQNLKEKLQLESAKGENTVHLECGKELEKVRMEMVDEHRKELEILKDMYEDDLKKQIEHLTYRMKQGEEEHVVATKSELLSKHVRDIQKLKDSFVDQTGRAINDPVLQKVDLEHKIHTDVRQQYEEEYQKKLTELRYEMQEKHAKELETRTEAERKIMAEQFDELTNIWKKSAEEEQDKFMANQKEMMLDFVKQHQQDLQTLKMQHEASLQAAQDECHHEVWLQQLRDKHEQEIGALQEEISRLMQEKGGGIIHTKNVTTVGVSTDQTDGDEELDTTTVRETTALHTIQQLRDELREKDAKFASAISEMKEMHESELQQVRAHCEGRLHDEVEQAKHDIARALEEEIQALLSNESEDTPCPRELIELQEKFTVHYKEELSLLKEEHANEVARLKKDHEMELQSLTKKYSQDIEVLEGQMATETTQHELEKTKLAMQIKLGDSSAVGTENAVSVLDTDLEQLIRERDCLRKITDTLRYLLRELVAYLNVCEDELNNTLIGELLKFEPVASKNSGELSKNNNEMKDQTLPCVPENVCSKSDDNTETRNDSSSIKNGETFSVESTVRSPQRNEILMPQDQVICDEVSVTSHSFDHSLIPLTERSSISAHGTHRVHFAPDASSIISLIDEDNLLDYIERNRDVSLDFRSELDSCLERLKAEAVAILGLSGTLPRTVQITHDAVMLLKEKVNILTNQLDVEVKRKDELLKQLENVEVKEKECVLLQEQLAKLKIIKEVLESDLRAARSQVTELERELGKREDVTEGFGESIEPCLVRRLHNMAQLQDKARSVLSERAFGDHKSPHLKLIEELCQEGDRLSEEARKERDDLQQQVEAADKQLRATRLFLEEQAAEREQERDDFLREIAKLHGQIRERDHDRTERERLTKEDAVEGSEKFISVPTVESLELQVKEATCEQKVFDLKKEELEMELKAAVDKIWMLRDIIGELESQIETRTEHEAALEQQLHQLHALLEQQGRTHQELTDELDSLRLESGKSELTEHISHLEEQLRKHRLHVEQFQSDSTAVRQMKAQLRDLEATVDKKTKELESFHATVSSASCSSPSEDVSIREQLDAFRSDTPEEARSAQSPVCLPLDELHRLQDKLLRHSRAEEVALKRIRDLEMELKGVKRNEEEVAAERDVLQECMEEQLLKISALQSRLDEQRQKTDSQLKEANLELQTKVHDQEKELNRLLETIENREQEVKELKIMFEETRKVMAAQEREWHTKTTDELEMIEKLTETCKKLKAEKGALEDTREEVGQFTPCLELLGVVLSQKNAYISSLRKEVEGLKNLLDPERQKEWEEVRHQMYMSGLRDEMRYQKGDVTEEMLSLDVLYTSPRDVTSGSQLDVSDKHLKAMLANKDREIISLKQQLEERINGDLSELQVELDKRNQRLLACETQLVDMPILKAENEALKKAIESVETDKEDCKKKLDAVKCSEGQVRVDLEQALKKLEEKQNEIDFLQSHISVKDDLLQGMGVNRQASVAQMGELLRHRSENSGLRSETAELEKELEILKQKILELAAENHNLKDDLNRLPGTPDELAGQVQKELDVLKQMDVSIMKKLDTEEPGLSEDVACTCAVSSTVLSQVLSKALREGISALKVSEFSIIYQEICRAAYGRIMQDSATQMEPEIMPASRADEDKPLMVAKISALESEVACKQQEAQKRIYDLEESLCQEKKHIHKMQEHVNQEQQWRRELQERLQLQEQSTVELEEQRDRLLELSSYQEKQLRQYAIDLEEERAGTRQLQDDLRKKESTIKNLEDMMNDERVRTRDAKLNDAALIENLRLKLEFQMAQMRRTQELGCSKDPVQNKCLCSNFQTLSSYKAKLESEQELCEKLKLELQKEKQKAENLEVAVKKEKQLGQQKVEIEREIIQELKREFLALEGQRDSLSMQLVHVREQLSLSRTETEAMERRVHMLQEADVRRQKKRLLDQREMERNRQELHKAQSLQFGLEQKIVDLEREVSRLKQELHERKEQVEAAELDQDIAQLRHEVEKLRQHMEGSKVREQQLSREPSSSSRVLSPVVDKLKNVNAMLEQHMTESAELAQTLSQLTEERQRLQARVKELEEKLSTALKAKEADVTDAEHVAFAAQRALCAQKKASFKLAMAKAEADVHGFRTDDGADSSDRNVNAMLEQHMTESAELAQTLSQLTEERQCLQARVEELEEKLSTALKAKAADVTDAEHVAFAAQRALCAQKKASFKLAMAKAEADVHGFRTDDGGDTRDRAADETDEEHVAFAAQRALCAQKKASFKLAMAKAEADVHGFRTDDGADSSDRVKYFNGRYLRAESYRKALVWQKRYLLGVLHGYQVREAIIMSGLEKLPGVQGTMRHQKHSAYLKKPRTRFKIAAIVVIALSRMRYLVRRWRLRCQIGSGAGLSRGVSESTVFSAQSSCHGPRRRGSSTSVISVGTSGALLQGSPPSRDRPVSQRWETDFVQHRVRNAVTPLRPNDVAEYVDRFDELQRRLGLSVITLPP
ncbi:A-kinase anchor protein 9 isoform X6 [Cryptotermes secundus]|uniref:A-kinase anchor protein 9 isoform X6 n=1 Tax=Cryptotermes secundus TaxID=105785 RepID=UPI001454CA54|nr:A-kinase anchor protein 9 isoform X6 [Cryptotermes secundus]